MIRDVVLHLSGEQPLLCDLREMPDPSDGGIMCTNLRTIDGKKPIYIDHTDSWFLFPFHLIRFVELPLASVEAASILALPPGPIVDPDAPDEEELDAAEELLQRIREV
ncbi:MAG: hypothetical protein KF809_04090 [Chloroflexi bacterium]|nr:hypothetical protein [Chloroflexota bacterium]